MRLTPITRNNRFTWLYKKGRSLVSPYVVVYAARNRNGEVRVGITAGKKLGTAVTRNRAKRVIRAAVYPLHGRLLPSYDYVFVARGKTAGCKSQELAVVLEKLLGEGGLIEKNCSASPKGL